MVCGISIELDPVAPPSKLYGGGRYPEFAYKSAPLEKNPEVENNSTVSDRNFDSLYHLPSSFSTSGFFL
jgi:hypothetical protein